VSRLVIKEEEKYGGTISSVAKCQKHIVKMTDISLPDGTVHVEL
jgi:hypothetical protein